MKTLETKTFELPLFEEQLFQLTFSLDEDTEPEHDPLTEGTLTVKESRADQQKGSVAVIHQVEDTEVGRYRFNVIDRGARICRYTGNDTPPWSIYCAVTEFGYHPQTVPGTTRKYTFDLVHAGMLELMQRTEKVDYEYLRGWGRRVVDRLHSYLIAAVLEYQVGPERIEDVYSFLNDRDGSEDDVPLYDQFLAVFREFNVEEGFLPHAIDHPSTNAIMSRYGEGTEQKPADKESEEESGVTWQIVRHDARGENGNEFYVSIIGADAIDRFSFQITDVDGGECVVQSGIAADLPPYAVIDAVRDEYEITNIPEVVYDFDLSYSELLVEIDRLVRQVTNQFPPESPMTKQLLDDYLNALELCLSVAATYETVPEAYGSGIDNVESQLGIELTAENVSDISHGNLDQITAAAFQSVDDTEAMQQLAQTLLDRTRVEDRRGTKGDEVADTHLFEQLLGPGAELSK